MLRFSEMKSTLVLAKDIVQTRQGDCSKDTVVIRFWLLWHLVFKDNGRLSRV